MISKYFKVIHSIIHIFYMDYAYIIGHYRYLFIKSVMFWKNMRTHPNV